MPWAVRDFRRRPDPVGGIPAPYVGCRRTPEGGYTIVQVQGEGGPITAALHLDRDSLAALHVEIGEVLSLPAGPLPLIPGEPTDA